MPWLSGAIVRRKKRSRRSRSTGSPFSLARAFTSPPQSRSMSRNPDSPSGPVVAAFVKPEFTSDVGEARRIHGAPVLGQFAQGVHAGFGEEGTGKVRMTACADFDQPTLHHALDGGR